METIAERVYWPGHGVLRAASQGLDRGPAEIDMGSQLVRDAGSTMNDIVASMSRVTAIMGEIKASYSRPGNGDGSVAAPASRRFLIKLRGSYACATKGDDGKLRTAASKSGQLRASKRSIIG